MKPLNIIPTIFFLVLPLAAGCSNSGQQSGVGVAEKEKQGFFDKVKAGIEEAKATVAAGQEAMKTVSEIIKQQPDVLKVLRGETDGVDWKNRDKSFLKQKALELKKAADSAGISLDRQPTALQQKLLGIAGKQMGISPERATELEAKLRKNRGPLEARAQAEGVSLATVGKQMPEAVVKQTAPQVGMAPAPMAGGDRVAKPQTTLAAPGVRSGGVSTRSSELEYILRRREERLLERSGNPR